MENSMVDVAFFLQLLFKRKFQHKVCYAEYFYQLAKLFCLSDAHNTTFIASLAISNGSTITRRSSKYQFLNRLESCHYFSTNL